LSSQVRTGILIADGRLFAGDATGRVYALDAATGRSLWQVRADDHAVTMVTATPVYHDGTVYVGVSSAEEALAVTPDYVCCTFRGSVLAIDAATGKLRWKAYTIAEAPKPGPPTRKGSKTIGPSGAGVWSAPTIDPVERLVYVLTGDNYSDPPTATSDALMAFHLDTGKLAWSKQYLAGDAYNSSCPLPDGVNCPDSRGPDFDFGSSAILLETPKLLLIAQKSGVVRGVDPRRQGAIVWETRVGKGGVLGGIQWGPASDGVNLYVALSDVGFTRRRVAGGNDVRIVNDPAFGGGLFALRVDNGERLWAAAPAVCGDRPLCSPAQSAAVTAIPGVVFSGAMDGHLRAYSTIGGAVIWDFDTVRDFVTVNGVPARGGGIDGGGPVVAGGMLFAGSGYAQFGGMPGNVVMAFSVDGR
jgi:polyvinyl alcohol dehydrogenase (cytochrome)